MSAARVSNSVAKAARQLRAGYQALFCQPDGSCARDKDTLDQVRAWFNSNYLIISLLTGIPLEPAAGDSAATILHIQSVSLTALTLLASRGF